MQGSYSKNGGNTIDGLQDKIKFKNINYKIIMLINFIK